MKIQLIRNATVKIEFDGKTWLVDPFFADINSLPPFAGKAKNPLVPLPFSISEILKDVDYIIITHLHPDHFDEKAKEIIPKSIPFIVQPADAARLQEMGFVVWKMEKYKQIQNTKVSRVDAQHGEGDILKVMGEVSGYVLDAENEDVLYITGDTIWCDKVKETLDTFSPQKVICNAGGNVFMPENHPFKDYISLKRTHKVIMDEQQVSQLLNYKKNLTVVTVHMGALDHETVSRESMKEFLEKKGIRSERFFIPENGELIAFL